jgi:F-type H+-transporting ATPase subunit b
MRFWLVIAVVVAVLAVSCAPASAAVAAGEAKADEHKTDAQEGGDDLFKGVLDLAIWTIVVFLLLLLVLRRYAWTPILRGLEQREKNIQSAIEDAKKAREEAAQMRQQYQQEIARANDEARRIRDEARHAAERMGAEFVAKGKAELQAERERLHHELDTSRDQALQQIWIQAAELATLISAKAVRRQLNADDHRRLLDESLAEFRQAGQARRQDIESARA